MRINEQEIILYGRRFLAFSCAEDAWIWCCRCKLELDGGNKNNKKRQEYIPRPCETIDIYCVIKSLERKGAISQKHIKIMVKFGLKLAPPSKKNANNVEIDLWNKAMEKLDEPLRKKRIVI